MKPSKGALTLTFLAVVAGCGGEPGQLPVHEAPVDVTASVAVASSAVKTLPASVVAEESAELATRVSGTIRRLTVDIGSAVSAGTPLATLDTDDVDARIESAVAAAELARNSRARISSLAADGAATEQELDDATARLEMAEAALRDARAQRDYVVLRAPFDGVITARFADPGDLALPGSPILSMIGTGGLKVEADLPAELAGHLQADDLIRVFRPETGERYPARITRVVPALEPSSRRFRIEARFAAAGTGKAGEGGGGGAGPAGTPPIPPGTYVRIEIGEPSALTRWIPADAVVERGQLRGVFVVDGEVLRLRWVRIGRVLDDAAELLAGPPADALLVREPPAALVDGQPLGALRRVEWSPPFAGRRTARLEEGR